MGVEIELKYLVDKLPFKYDKKIYFEQRYYDLETIGAYIRDKFPEYDLNCFNTFRLRIKNKLDDYYFEIKSKGDLERIELGVRLTKEEFGKIKNLKPITKVIKYRYICYLEGMTFEFDEYSNFDLSGFTCEVEFATLDELNEKKHIVEELFKNYFKLSFEDVSLDKRYKNAYLYKSFKERKLEDDA